MKQYQKIALDRIKILFQQAQESFKEHPERSHRYVQLARKIAMKSEVSMPKSVKKKFCKHCYKFLQPGTNCRVRTKDQKLIYYCLSCKKYMRFVINKRSHKPKSSSSSRRVNA